MMTSAAPIPAGDLRAHSGVTCRLCHGVARTTFDGNGSYVWNATPPDGPVLGDPASIQRHRKQVTTKVDTELCVGCHRGFLSPDMGMPVHLAGVDETGAWRACVDRQRHAADRSGHAADVHRLPHGARRGVGRGAWREARHDRVASLRRGSHVDGRDARRRRTARGDAGTARGCSVDRRRGCARDQYGVAGPWQLPADGAPVRAGTRLEPDVVIRNLLVGHRFPGGVLDVQDTWVEVEVTDRHGHRLAASGLAHASHPDNQATHVLRTLVVDDGGELLDEHELPKFRAQLATQTLGPREAQAIRYALSVPAGLARDALPLTVTARLRHRSRTLHLQAATCRAARTPEGQAFVAGARGARDIESIRASRSRSRWSPRPASRFGDGVRITTTRPAWERSYEHGMALAATVVTRLPEARAVLEIAHARRAPDTRARWSRSSSAGSRRAKAVSTTRSPMHARHAPSSRRAAGACRHRRGRRRCVRAREPVGRRGRAGEVVHRARAAERRRVALVRASRRNRRSRRRPRRDGSWPRAAPRDPDLLRSQATALAALHDPRAEAAQAAYVRFRSPDDAAGLVFAARRGRRAVRAIATRWRRSSYAEKSRATPNSSRNEAAARTAFSSSR